jgi:hypothetical protein
VATELGGVSREQVERANRSTLLATEADLLEDLGRADEARALDKKVMGIGIVQPQALIREAEKLVAEGRNRDAEKLLWPLAVKVHQERDVDFRFPKVSKPSLRS